MSYNFCQVGSLFEVSDKMATLVATPGGNEEKIPKIITENEGVNGIKEVIVHPLVLLSVVDHFNRAAATTGDGRAVGLLLGTISKGRLDVANSFASKLMD